MDSKPPGHTTSPTTNNNNSNNNNTGCCIDNNNNTTNDNNLSGPEENPANLKPKSLVEQNKIILDYCIDAAAVKGPIISAVRTGSLNRFKYGRRMTNPDIKAYPILNINSCDKSRQMSEADDQNTDFIPKSYKYVSMEPSMSSVSSTLEPEPLQQSMHSFKKKSISTNLANATAINIVPNLATIQTASKKSKNDKPLERATTSNESNNSKSAGASSESKSSKESCSKESKNKTESDIKRELKESKSVDAKREEKTSGTSKDSKSSQESKGQNKGESKSTTTTTTPISTKSKSNSKKHKAGGSKTGKSNQNKTSKGKGSGGTSGNANTKSKKKHSK